MKNLQEALLILLICVSHIVGSTVYVDSSAVGENTGKSWKNAFKEFQSALRVVTEGDSICVAQGTYYPAPKGGARENVFKIGADLTILGGYERGGTSRNYKKHSTILSGDIERDDVREKDSIKNVENNSYAVIYSDNAVNTVLDGFTISAPHDERDGNQTKISGALNVNAWKADSNAVFIIQNCRVENTSIASSGSGLWFKGRNCRIVNCIFENNMNGSVNGGGAVYFEGKNLEIIGTELTGNKAYRGGAVNFKGVELKIENSFMENNTAFGEGGGSIFFSGQSLSVNGTGFKNNVSNDGTGGVVFFMGRVCRISDCTFTSNGASHAGGVLDFRGDSCLVVMSQFTDNTATYSGGAVYFRGTGLFLEQCGFKQNKSQKEHGGAVYFEGYELVSMESEYDKNVSYGSGGAITFRGTSLTSENDEFTENLSEKADGGAISFQGKNINVNGTTFLKNKAYEQGGGALVVRTKSFVSDGCSYEENVAAKGNGGAVNFEGNELEINKCHFVQNSAQKGLGGAVCYKGKRVAVDSSEFSENQSEIGGALYYHNDISDRLRKYEGFSSNNTKFNSNYAKKYGGAVFWLGRGSLYKCIFDSNKAFQGGAVHGWTVQTAPLKIRKHDSLHIQKIASIHSDVRFRECKFAGNSAETGAVLVEIPAQLNECIIKENSSSRGKNIILSTKSDTEVPDKGDR